MAQACEDYVLRSMNLTSKQVSKLLINGIAIFKDLCKKEHHIKHAQ